MTGNEVIYLDYNASTSCDPHVVDAMLPHLARAANPASLAHHPGRAATLALEEARENVARFLGRRVRATEITFTSGATEANNLALLGAARARADRGRRLVAQVTEHASVLEPLRALEAHGWEVVLVGVDGRGVVRLDQLEAALSHPGTTLLSLMLANNETGVVQPVAKACRLAAEHGVAVHCDAAQGPGKLRVDVDELGVDLLTLSGHKVYGPPGVGALYIRRSRPPLLLEPLLRGGGQERGLRPGSPNLPGAAGLAAALALAADRLVDDSERMARLRDRLEARLHDAIDGLTVNGAAAPRLPNTSNLSFEGIDGNALLASLPDVAVSTGSACTSATPAPSGILRAMGVAPELAAASLRISIGRGTTDAEVDRAARRVAEEVMRLRAMGGSRRP